MRKQSIYNQIISVLQELHRDYPNYNIGRHLATAFDEYGDVWGLTDGEVLFALQKYKTQIDMDSSQELDIQRIIKDGLDLDNILKEEENGEY